MIAQSHHRLLFHSLYVHLSKKSGLEAHVPASVLVFGLYSVESAVPTEEDNQTNMKIHRSQRGENAVILENQAKVIR